MNRKQSQEERRQFIENAVTKALKEARDQAAQELRKSMAAATASKEAAIISAREEAARGKISLSFVCFVFFVWSVVVAMGAIQLWDRQQSEIHAKMSEERKKEEAKQIIKAFMNRTEFSPTDILDNFFRFPFDKIHEVFFNLRYLPPIQEAMGMNAQQLESYLYNK